MKQPKYHQILFPCLALLAVSCSQTMPVAPPLIGRIDPAATAALKAAADQLQAARTLRVSATQKLDPSLGFGTALDDGPIEITLQRPNKFHAIQDAGPDTREIAYDGRQFCMMHPEMKHHALESLRASCIDQFAGLVDDRFGFRPPIVELLSEDVVNELLVDVTSVQVVGTESVRGSRCQRVHLRQKGVTTDLWIGESDQLPKRLYFTFTDLPDQPGWDITFTGWETQPHSRCHLVLKTPGSRLSQSRNAQEQLNPRTPKRTS